MHSIVVHDWKKQNSFGFVALICCVFCVSVCVCSFVFFVDFTRNWITNAVGIRFFHFQSCEIVSILTENYAFGCCCCCRRWIFECSDWHRGSMCKTVSVAVLIEDATHVSRKSVDFTYSNTLETQWHRTYAANAHNIPRCDTYEPWTMGMNAIRTGENPCEYSSAASSVVHELCVIRRSLRERLRFCGFTQHRSVWSLCGWFYAGDSPNGMALCD